MSFSQFFTRWGRTAMTAVVVALVCLVSYGFSSRILGLYTTLARISDLESEVVDLRATMNVDSLRQFHIRKITRIIDQYNPEMDPRQRYAIANEVYEASQKYTNLSVELICATITKESGRTWKTNLVSPAGAMGLMQIRPVTGLFTAMYEGITWTNPKEVLFNPTYNIRIGTRYLSTLIDQYGMEGGLAAYNGGENLAAMWIAQKKDNSVLHIETQQYVPAVLSLVRAYKRVKG